MTVTLAPVATSAQAVEDQPQRPLTARELRFVQMVAVGGWTGVRAYMECWKCKHASAERGAARIRSKPEIRAAIERATKQRLADMLPKAVGRLDQLIDAQSEKVSLEAVKATLDRTGVPSQRSDRAGIGNGLAVTINIRSGHAGQVAEQIVITAPQQDE